MEYTIYNGELYHHGIKGMKWGVRRYQNANGSLTPAGKKRYDKEYNSLSEKKQATYKPNIDEWVKSDIRNVKNVADTASSLGSKLKEKNASKIKTKTTLDLSKMTDNQMREQINRKLLEKQYNEMFAPEKVNQGRLQLNKILEGAITTLSVTSSALGIALAIKELKG